MAGIVGPIAFVLLFVFIFVGILYLEKRVKDVEAMERYLSNQFRELFLTVKLREAACKSCNERKSETEDDEKC